MPCKACSSDGQGKFRTEMNFHFPGREGWEKPAVWVFLDVLVCLNCGLAEFEVPANELRALVDGLGGEPTKTA